MPFLFLPGLYVFNFVQTEVPPMIAHAFEVTGKCVDDFDWFFFHQPNKFMLQKLSEKAGLPSNKLPMNLVENFGNPSGASIPLTMIFNCRDELLMKKNKCCLTAFGSGLAWCTSFMDIGPFHYCGMIEASL